MRTNPRCRSLERRNMVIEGSTFTWKVRNFSKLKPEVLESSIFTNGGYKWCLRVYPMGVKMENNNLSLYLSVADLAGLPNGWSRLARFSVVLINQFDTAHSVNRDAEHRFHFGSRSWGWESFLHLDKLRDSSGGLLVEDTFIIKVEFFCIIQAQEKEEPKLTIKEEVKEHEPVSREDEDHEKSQGVEEMTQAKTEKQAIQREENIENFTAIWTNNDEEGRRENCLNQERECVKREEESEVKGRNINEKLKRCEQIWLTMTKRRKTENEAMNLTQTQSSKAVLPIGFQKVDDLAASICNNSDKSPTPLENFAALFEDISRVVGASVSSSVSTPEAVGSTEAIEISLSLSLLKQVADKPFCQIPSSLWPELSKAFNVLNRASSLSSAQSSAITNFSNQFDNLCGSYDSSCAALDITQQFLNRKYDTFLALKRLSESQLEIKNSLDRLRKERDQLLNRFMELDGSEFDLLEDYNNVGLEAEGVKAEWDRLNAVDADMAEQIEKAENELAGIETDWSRFTSLFK